MAMVATLHRVPILNQLLLKSGSPSCARAFIRHNSGFSKRWPETRGHFVNKDKRAELLSRAALRLLEINEIYRIFRSGQTVVDLGFAPGAWSQVAIDKVTPNGRVIGVDILPALPPAGVSTLQGSMKSPLFRDCLKRFLADPDRGKRRETRYLRHGEVGEDELEEMEKGYIDRERSLEREQTVEEVGPEKSVDVLLSDMCEPWPVDSLSWKKSLDNPFFRLVNKGGIPARDHAYSIDLCYTALAFGLDVLKTQCSFVCKVYGGDEEDELKRKLGLAFSSVNAFKLDQSKDELKEVYYVAKVLEKGVDRKSIFPKEDY